MLATEELSVGFKNKSCSVRSLQLSQDIFTFTET